MASYQPAHLKTGSSGMPGVDKQISRRRLVACLLIVCSCLPGCGETPQTTTATDIETEPLSINLERWQQQQSLAAIQQTTRLVATTGAFLAEPNEETRRSWQASWIAAHESWLRASTLVPDPAGTIDPWPVQPGFFDSLPLYPNSGIVNDHTVTLSEAGLRFQHQITDESEVTLGFHIIEYYAFDRDIVDFTAEKTGSERRILLLNLVSNMLLKDQLALSQQFDLEDNLVPAGLPLTLEGLARQLHRQLEEVYDDRHGEFSDTTPDTIHTSLGVLQELMRDTTNLEEYLESIDPVAARTFQQTLDEALALLAPPGPLAESSAARLLLLLASLTHQIEDLIRQLPGEAQV